MTSAKLRCISTAIPPIRATRMPPFRHTLQPTCPVSMPGQNALGPFAVLLPGDGLAAAHPVNNDAQRSHAKAEEQADRLEPAKHRPADVGAVAHRIGKGDG